MSWQPFVRVHEGQPAGQRFGPKVPDHPTTGQPCPACLVPFAQGDFTCLIALGPGDAPDEQARCREGRPYNAVAVEVHWSCATGAE